MGSTTLAVTAPHATAYDANNPTRSTENYSHALHEILQDMEDATGEWYLYDGVFSTSEATFTRQFITDTCEVVFDYAASAVEDHKGGDPILLAEPIYTNLPAPSGIVQPYLMKITWETWQQAMKIMYFIYYLWKSETDPLLLKEKLQELLIAWPLTDLTVELNTEAGQEMKIFPSWKNVDL